MKHEQQPATAVIRKCVLLTSQIRQTEVRGRLVDVLVHGQPKGVSKAKRCQGVKRCQAARSELMDMSWPP